MGARFRIPAVVFEGVDTGDRRRINPQALTHRALPLSLMGMVRNPDGGYGHDGAVVAGRIDTMTREDVTDLVDEATGQTWGQVGGGAVFAWAAEGEFADTAEAQQVEELVRARALRGVSVDLAEVTAEEEILAVDEDGWPTDWILTVTEGMIAAATVCSVPAFRGCTIELVDDGTPEPAAGDTSVPAQGGAAQVQVTVTASAEALPPWRIINDGPGCSTCETDPDRAAVIASGGPMRPPAGWFTDPALPGPTPLTVDDDGRVYGHLAAWGTCHTGQQGTCVTPPRSGTGYALFRVGAVRTAEGDDVAVGHITLGTGHADIRASASAAVEHYDHTGTVVADVAAGEDDHGIWVAGALRPDVTDLDVRALRASALSGDWRRHGHGLELVAALAVNVPGFPIPRALAASGVPSALVAAGAAPISAVKARQGAPVDVAALVHAEVAKATAPFRAERALARLRTRP